MAINFSDKALSYARSRLSGNTVPASRKGRLIAIEGLDGTGKTTAVNHLAEAIDAIPLSSPISKIYRETRAQIDAAANAAEHFSFFHGANIYDSATVLTPAMEEGKIIVLDRYEFTTLVGHVALDVDVDKALDEVDKNADPIPADITIFLRLQTAERMRRLMERSLIKPNSKYDVDTDYQSKMAALYDQLIKEGMMEADINGLDVEGVTAKLIEILKRNNILPNRIDPVLAIHPVKHK